MAAFRNSSVYFVVLTLISLIYIVFAKKPSDPSEQTCGLIKDDGVSTFTFRSHSPDGDIPLIHLQYDVNRKLAITSTVIHNAMNLKQNDVRTDHFRMIKCDSLKEKQQNCAKTFSVTEKQKEKNGGEYKTWDRGHLTPVNPMRFSNDAVDVTFYCPNIAPQEPWTNRCPWYGIEERILKKNKLYPSYVITGLCPQDATVDGPTEHGHIVPDCFWKLNCYVDPASKETKVVAWIGKNTILSAANLAEEKKLRKESTLLPRGQKEVLELMAGKEKYLENAWMAAEKELTKGRNTTGLPDAQACFKTKEVSKETVEEWAAFIKKHRPPFYCNENKNKKGDGKGDKKGDDKEDENGDENGEEPAEE